MCMRWSIFRLSRGSQCTSAWGVPRVIPQLPCTCGHVQYRRTDTGYSVLFPAAEGADLLCGGRGRGRLAGSYSSDSIPEVCRGPVGCGGNGWRVLSVLDDRYLGGSARKHQINKMAEFIIN